MQEDVEQGLVDADAAVVFDHAELAEAVHEEADAGAGGADHFSESGLGDGRDEGFGFTGDAEFGHEEEDSGEAFFAGIEELIDEIGLGAHAAGEQEPHEEVRECMILVHGADHVAALDSVRGAGGDGGCGGDAAAADAGQGFLSDEVAVGKQGDGGFFTAGGDDGEFGAAFLKIEDRVSWTSLRKEGLLWL